jgi:uncharacterized protein (TIRG00374 family)
MDDTNKKFRKPSKGQVLRWVGTLISSVLFISLLLRQDWAKTMESLANAPFWLLPVVFALYVSGMVINSLRWNLLLRAQNVTVPIIETLKLVITGAFASNFLPSTIGGDTLRAVGLLKFNVSLTLSAASVVLDRLMNVLAMMTFLPFSFVVFGNRLELFSSGIRGLIFSEPSFVLLGMVSLTKGWTERWIIKLKNWFTRVWDIVKVWLHRPGVLVGAFVLSWLSSFVIFFGIWILARGLGMDIALYEVMGIMVLTYFISMLPISINGYGLREVAVTALYMQVGASLEQASTLAVITRFMLLLETLPGALWLSDIVTPEKKGEETT